MSLLEDVFLEDEAEEAEELERVIEADEFDERPRSAASNSDDDSEKEDEATEDKRQVDPTKAKTTRIVKNPRVILNPARLTGPRGIQVIPDHFKDFKFKGKGHEKQDLDLLLKKLEHWAYRLFPKFDFGDCLKKIETLGKKKPVMVHLHKIRSDQYTTEEMVVQRGSSDEEPLAQDQPPEEDEFDKLLQQQIELARATPAPRSVTKCGFETPGIEKRSPFTVPKAASSPSISDEQRDRMIRNRQLAQERRFAKLKQTTITNTNTATVKKHNILNVIDEEDSNAVNKSVTVDIQLHETAVKDVTEVNDESASKNIIDGQEINGNKPVKKQNKSKVVDSFNDESNAGNQHATIDVEMPDTTVKDVIEVNDQFADIYNFNGEVNSSGKGNNITVDLTEGIPIKHSSVFTEGQVIDINEDSGDIGIRKHDESNVVDSSDKECEMIAFNQGISVDVHGKDTVSIEKQTLNSVKSKNVDSNDKDHETEVIDVHFEQTQNIMSQDNRIDDIEVTKKHTTKMSMVREHNENNGSEMVTNVKDARNVSLEMSKDNKDNVEGNVQNEANNSTEELMDVDFSDDF